jgi:hypothetical protein
MTELVNGSLARQGKKSPEELGTPITDKLISTIHFDHLICLVLEM